MTLALPCRASCPYRLPFAPESPGPRAWRFKFARRAAPSGRWLLRGTPRQTRSILGHGVSNPRDRAPLPNE